MKIIIDMGLEEKFTNIGFAKALTELPFFRVEDLCEIIQYLVIYTDARNSVRYYSPCDCAPKKGAE